MCVSGACVDVLCTPEEEEEDEGRVEDACEEEGTGSKGAEEDVEEEEGPLAACARARTFARKSWCCCCCCEVPVGRVALDGTMVTAPFPRSFCAILLCSASLARICSFFASRICVGMPEG